MFAEFEINIRKERQLEGMTKPAIAEKVGISVASVYDVLKASDTI